jgi:hypothetical protein
MKNLAAILMGVGCGLSLVGWSVPAQSATVDLEIAFILDGSGSIQDPAWTLQRNAYYQIFTDPSFYDTHVGTLIGKPLPGGGIGSGKIAVASFQFASTVQQDIAWTLIEDQASATAFGSQFFNLAKLGGETSLGKGIQLATQSIFSNNYDSYHQGLDLSSDGVDDPAPGQGLDPRQARDDAEEAGVDVMNIIGTPVVNANLLNQLTFGTNIDGAPAFMLTGDKVNQYQSLLRTKIRREITGTKIPEPGTVLGLLSIGLLAMTMRVKGEG